MSPIKVGDSIPDGFFSFFDENNSLQKAAVHSLFAGKKVVFVGVPGAFTPTCSSKHVPGFIAQAEELKSKGVDEIFVFSVTAGNNLNLLSLKTNHGNRRVSWILNGMMNPQSDIPGRAVRQNPKETTKAKSAGILEIKMKQSCYRH
ncbi:hypothetical protein AMTR_s00109p00099750 [Amborella trichopoda]|uniref:glutaredoxin-dependent peroxiredoxin n=1 Tax=Amborella trichopoda TaxID=13333 RepID=W1NPK4_AMBTC|nr:hypothetical protein AMTR_s00109p00099750 [Amborella trichopoda]